MRLYQSAWPLASVRYLMNWVAAALCSLSLEITREEPCGHGTEDLSVGTLATAHLPFSCGWPSFSRVTCQGPPKNIGTRPLPKSFTTS